MGCNDALTSARYLFPRSSLRLQGGKALEHFPSSNSPSSHSTSYTRCSWQPMFFLVSTAGDRVVLGVYLEKIPGNVSTTPGTAWLTYVAWRLEIVSVHACVGACV